MCTYVQLTSIYPCTNSVLQLQQHLSPSRFSLGCIQAAPSLRSPPSLHLAMLGKEESQVRPCSSPAAPAPPAAPSRPAGPAAPRRSRSRRAPWWPPGPARPRRGLPAAGAARSGRPPLARASSELRFCQALRRTALTPSRSLKGDPGRRRSPQGGGASGALAGCLSEDVAKRKRCLEGRH